MYAAPSPTHSSTSGQSSPSHYYQSQHQQQQQQQRPPAESIPHDISIAYKKRQQQQQQEEEQQLLWFAAPPVHVTPLSQPTHSVAYLNCKMLPRNIMTLVAARCRPVTVASPVFAASKRKYTMTPVVPQPGEAKELASNQDKTDIHALYNKDNVSMLEADHHHDTQHRSLSSSSDSGEPSDSFSPTFNTVFDE
ncbi:hypothetical protein BDB00DRAFT_877430 [Zychaea mexicana]|uniref:uncharacterized protein n=1 Tax=Zychaea mexicana TaxID=64656 RepID=UPI0022FF344C|nr:uncharacterized protein BDB00DRAFT_877430 [Zychaea mexicana]KAI9488465.1 hypothetical protein BDB00DRAFT_877430 [Zychaea mexicana]